ncbi:MAG: hypothetical protein HUK21_01895 [Fibrobacteraceae bacterium]|nr:hypothetical protein [Fibrobacteraceae bacterium]
MNTVVKLTGILGVILGFSACTDDNSSLVRPEVSESGSVIIRSSNSHTPVTSTSTVIKESYLCIDESGASSQVSTPEECASGNVEVKNDTIHHTVTISASSTGKSEDINYSDGVFCWEGSTECESNNQSAEMDTTANKKDPISGDDNNNNNSQPIVEEENKEPVVNGDQMVDQRDQNSYKLIVIGGSTWMGENIRYKPASGSYCYESSDTKCASYGRLYNQSGAKKACPLGWHLPTRAESKAAMDDASVSWQYGGRKSTSSDYGYIDQMGFFWMAVSENIDNSTDKANCSSGSCGMIFVVKAPDYGDGERLFQQDSADKGFSVRCVKD